jgi:acetoacetyl-CoA synthetase
MDVSRSPDLEPLWKPSPARMQAARVSAFMQAANARFGLALADYAALYAWSVAERADFWRLVWDFCAVRGEPGERVLVDGERMPGARWFPEARLNFAENLLRRRDDADALVFRGEDRVRRRLSHRELYEQVTRVAQALRAAGVRSGDRVAAYLPNMPESVIAMLAATSIGATWCSCSPDFGVRGVVDRFGQIAPRVLFAVEGYYYGGRGYDCLDKLRGIVAALPTLERVVVVPYTRPDPALAGIAHATPWDEFAARPAQGPLEFARLPFDHPVYIMFSSGTTGVPKCIVHGAGGTLLQHLKEHVLHTDTGRDDRVYYFTTCSWMMWNWLVSALAAEATLLLYDGSPFHPGPQAIFDYADAERMTVLGTSAKFLEAVAKSGLVPRASHGLASVRTLLSTGSPLAPQSFDFVYGKIKPDLCLASISGGTDIISCFALGSPLLPVWRGELQCRGLGMAVEVWDDAGRAVRGEKGELVCVKPFPSMPVGFWNDPDGSRYRAAYFARFANVWCHGDYAELTAHDGLVIYGRSDAVLTPGGVRIGTAEIYREVEQVEEVLESLVIAQDWEQDVRIVLFVRLREGARLDEALAAKIRQRIREHATPRHVPAKVLQVGDIPRTKSGKIVELAVRAIVHGQPVRNLEALANPEALAQFRDRPELAS